MTPRQRKVSRVLSMFSLVALTSLLSAEPAFAQTNLESFGNAVLGLLSNGLLRIVAIPRADRGGLRVADGSGQHRGARHRHHRHRDHLLGAVDRRSAPGLILMEAGRPPRPASACVSWSA
ncbi:hypothetical protein [Sphingomonas hankookensis]|uniref:hypothetical protein n=1 Tax=Sphingomonas hankookensis TaxID=563996 RepID=UPI003F79A98D